MKIMSSITKGLSVYNRFYIIEQLNKKLSALEYSSNLSQNYSKSSIRQAVYLDAKSSMPSLRDLLIQQEYLAFVKTLNKV